LWDQSSSWHSFTINVVMFWINIDEEINLLYILWMIKINKFVKRYFKIILSGSGCGSVGRAVASDIRGPQFESSHWQKFIYILNFCLLSTVYWKDKNKEKEAGNGPFLKKIVYLHLRSEKVKRKINQNQSKIYFDSFFA